MADGGNVPQAARIICPYFKRLTDNRRVIVCEGLTPGVCTATMFRRREEQERYSEKYCERYSYGRCPVARAVALKLVEREQKKGRY